MKIDDLKVGELYGRIRPPDHEPDHHPWRYLAKVPPVKGAKRQPLLCVVIHPEGDASEIVSVDSLVSVERWRRAVAKRAAAFEANRRKMRQQELEYDRRLRELRKLDRKKQAEERKAAREQKAAARERERAVKAMVQQTRKEIAENIAVLEDAMLEKVPSAGVEEGDSDAFVSDKIREQGPEAVRAEMLKTTVVWITLSYADLLKHFLPLLRGSK